MSTTVKITWIVEGGERITANVPVGQSVMEASIMNDIPGIDGNCGGCLACATCHIVVEDAPVDLGVAGGIEVEMLESADVPPTEKSRLSCQIAVTEELDGLVVRVPGGWFEAEKGAP